MKLLAFLAVVNAFCAVISAFLGMAPFTPAIAFFVVYAPVAAVLGYLNQPISGLVVAGVVPIAWLLSPLRFDPSAVSFLRYWVTWVAVWSLIAAYFGVVRLHEQLSAQKVL
jgi:hypothetical protein